MERTNEDYNLPPIVANGGIKENVLRPLHAALAALDSGVACVGDKVEIKVTLHKVDNCEIKPEIRIVVYPRDGIENDAVWKILYNVLQENTYIE